MPSLSESLTLADQLHDGVQDCSGEPYISHPLWVMTHLPAIATEDDRHLALLHDTVEDCRQRLAVLMAEEMNLSVAEEDIAGFFEFFRYRGYSPYMIDGLRLVTRDLWPDLSYLDQIRQIAASGHRGAILVKDTDNWHNSDPERIACVLPEFRDRVCGSQKRYAKSRAILKPAIEALTAC